MKVPDEKDQKLQELADAIRCRSDAAAYQTGKDLIKGKKLCGYGLYNFLELAGIDQRSAISLMRYAEIVKDNNLESKLPHLKNTLRRDRYSRFSEDKILLRRFIERTLSPIDVERVIVNCGYLGLVDADPIEVFARYAKDEEFLNFH